MPEEILDYKQFMQEAIVGVMARALGCVAQGGLPGDHHFYVEYDTTHPGVVMPDWLREQYPEKIMIILQNEFWNLAVLEDRFSVELSFNDRPATLVVPFKAVINFIDPSVNFGLAFEASEDQSDDDDATTGEAYAETENAPLTEADSRQKEGDVVSLDSFRKK